ncbi:hypothetical protein IQ251_00460 [Saccharopolyspora sp. HNM0983]|uniref:Uncharacterized protein n=1 Tax=Saccharopolyspora montiporae TaxID=2781240 RepID=A0A929FXZ7_9PSEU|nr:hypothetical protein [Saccharopolyspora sp. HNM0983]MBE9372909.1 hypothetical protein [Saccharopolyspora sp. HNM0983]
MAITVTVRVSEHMDKADLAALGTWLETTYPGHWERTPAPEVPDTLGGTGEVLIGLLEGFVNSAGTAVGGVAAEAVRKQISDKLKQLREQYPRRDRPDAQVEVDEEDEDRTDPREGS